MGVESGRYQELVKKYAFYGSEGISGDMADRAARSLQATVDVGVVEAKQNIGYGMTWDGKPRDCEDCHEPISNARLKAIPNARRCTACQELISN